MLGSLLRPPKARRAERARYARAREILARVGLADRVDDDAGELPPGDRRMLELARVLALEPRLVLMDEPAGGLNEVEIERLERFVEELRDDGAAVLLVEHNVDLVMRIADSVTVLNFGRVISEGEPEEVRRDPRVIAGYLGDEGLDPRETAAVGTGGDDGSA
jgi:ABC-type branched-subunit amino acid transport system ATPase component